MACIQYIIFNHSKQFRFALSFDNYRKGQYAIHVVNAGC